MRKAIAACVAVLALCVPTAALAGPTPKGVAWQLTAALQKRETFLGKHYGFYGAKCITQVAGRSWACTVRSRTLGVKMLFPDVALKGDAYSFGSPTVL